MTEPVRVERLSRGDCDDLAKMLTATQTVTEFHQYVDTLDKSTKTAAYTSAPSNARKLSIMEPLPTALVLSWSANTLRVECPFCLSSHGHGVGKLPRGKQSRTADCNRISGGQSYRVLYPDEESDFTVPFGWELDKEENLIYTVTHQGRLLDPLSLRSQPRRLLDEHRHSSWPDENDKVALEDEVAIADSLKNMRLSDSEELDNQPTRVDTIWRDLMNDQSYRHKCYVSACCLKDMKQLEALE